MSKIRVSEGDEFEIDYQSRAFASRPQTIFRVDGDTGATTLAVDNLSVAGQPVASDISVDGISSGDSTLATLDTRDLPSKPEVWVKSVRRSFYLDRASELDPVSGVVVPAVGGGNWISNTRSDRAWQEKQEWWFRPGGTVDGAADNEATAINSIAELGRRIGDGGGVTTTTTFYTEANLSVDEQKALEDVIVSTGRVWRVVSGELPFVPRLRFSAQNIDGADNTTLVAGQEIDWTSVGSDVAVAAGTPGARPIFVPVAEVGKLRGKSAVRFTSALQDLVTGNLAAFTYPTWRFSIVKVNASGSRVWVDGNDGAHRNAFIDSATSLVLYAGASSGGIPGLPAMTKGEYHAVVGVFCDDRSVAGLDGVESTNACSTGTQALDGLSIGGVLSTAPLADGDVVEVIVTDGVGWSVFLLRDFIEYHYGVMPQ